MLNGFHILHIFPKNIVFRRWRQLHVRPIYRRLLSRVITRRVFFCFHHSTNAVPVYNLSQHNLNPITWGTVMLKGREETLKNPFELMLWYPSGGITSNRFVHQYKVIFYHWLPAYLIDGIMFLLGQKRL